MVGRYRQGLMAQVRTQVDGKIHSRLAGMEDDAKAKARTGAKPGFKRWRENVMRAVVRKAQMQGEGQWF